MVTRIRLLQFLVLFQDSRFRELFMMSYKTHNTGMSLGWDLVEEVTFGTRLTARSRIECANVCWARQGCAGILFNKTNVEACQLLR